MKTKDILRIPLITTATHTPDEISEMYKTLHNTTKRRYNQQLRELGDVTRSPAIRHLLSSTDGHAPIYDKNISTNQKVHMIAVYRQFINERTSTLKGTREYERRIAQTLGRRYTQWSSTTRDNFWTLYNHMADNQPVDWSTMDSNQRANTIMTVLSNRRLSIEDAAVELENIVAAHADRIRAQYNVNATFM